MGRLLPLIEVSVNICAIVSDFTGNSGGLQRWRLVTKCIYLLYRQAVNVKLIRPIVISQNITDFKVPS